MAYLVEQHTQIQISHVRKFLKLGHGFEAKFSKSGIIEQTLNAHWKNDYLIFEWLRKGKKVTQKTRLSKTETHFGNGRLWWQCPNCSNSCGALFDFGGVWACRKCGGLKYKTASKSKSERDLAYFERFKEKYLRESNHVGIDYLYSFHRPKWMKKDKWEALIVEHNERVERLFRQMSSKLNR
jgi:hypothetical protein